MASEPTVSVRHLPNEDRVEVTLRRGFTRKDLDVVRALLGRSYDARRRVWTVPDGPAAIACLLAALGADGVRVDRGPGPSADAASRPSSEVLDQVRDALTVRGYSPGTRKVYLGHLR